MESLFNISSELEPKKVAYLAGFFDGEGCISAYHHKSGTWILRISVTNTEPEPVRRFQDTFGGSIGYIDRKSQKWKNCYMWRLHGNKCIWALQAMLPYLTIKRERAIMAIEFQQLRQIGLGRRETLGKQIKRLNRKGN